ncbi:MAG TPA: M14 family zinc carboxypeptidase [Saprospiraceae bacterium]|nr:M14 family zinc carboxypeptidase [Saprospiraceae bacterium]
MNLKLKFLFCVFLFYFIKLNAQQDWITPFEQNKNQTCTYHQCIAFYKALSKSFPKLVKVNEIGPSDVSYPVHEVILSSEGFDPRKAKQKNKLVLMINNGIHPGEPEGIDASMILARECCLNPQLKSILKDITLVIIPIYNVGGSLRRNSTTRVNQNGPESYGFRGNMQNLDLNRDFIKCDSRNAMSFTACFQKWQPDVFVDTHTSDGADYPYNISLITTQRDKLSKPLSEFLFGEMLPKLYAQMALQQDEMVPYVELKDIPENGIYDFLETPRYSTGYTSLFHCLSFMTETHMLKPFAVRVESTKRFLHLLLKTSYEYKSVILQKKKESIKYEQSKSEYTIKWKLNDLIADSIEFRSYPTMNALSPIIHQAIVRYDKTMEAKIKIPFFNHFEPAINTKIPAYYIIPQAYHQITLRLDLNKIQYTTLSQDSCIQVSSYRIDKFASPEKPYEHHFLHRGVELTEIPTMQCFMKGDLLIPTTQFARRYIIECLEPQAADSYFAWNFFDGMLQRKEYFSDYLFEPMVETIFKQNPELQSEFTQKQAQDTLFSQDGWEQLYYIYSRSQFSESSYMLYPVAKLY